MNDTFDPNDTNDTGRSTKPAEFEDPVHPVDALFSDAKSEFADEVVERYKKVVKDKLAERRKAQKVVNNIDRELAELKLKIQQEIEAGA